VHNKEKSFVSSRNERPGLAISTHFFVQLMSEGTLIEKAIFMDFDPQMCL
jgi:hypothetical protein